MSAARRRADHLANPGYLKLDLMLHGVRVDEQLLAGLDMPGDFCTDFGHVGDLMLVLPEETWVAVPFRAEFCKRSPYTLARRGDAFVVADGRGERPVRVVPAPGFYRRRTRAGVAVHEIGALRGGTLALAPDRSCVLIGSGRECRFCSAVLFKPAEAVHSLDDVLDTVEAARAEQVLDMVYVSIGLMPGEDRGVRLLEPYVREIKRKFDVLVGIDMCPPATDDWIDRTYAMGVDTVSYNLEVFDPARFREVCPGLSAEVGRDRYLAALRYAGSVFPPGAVTSHLIVGLESPSSTMAGIDALTDLGVVPVLPIFRPQKGIDLRGLAGPKVPKAAEVAPVYGYVYQQLLAKKIPTRWVRDIAVVTTPLEGRFFVGEPARLEVFLQSFFSTRLGRRYMARLSDLRRALRVREAPGRSGT